MSRFGGEDGHALVKLVSQISLLLFVLFMILCMCFNFWSGDAPRRGAGGEQSDTAVVAKCGRVFDHLVASGQDIRPAMYNLYMKVRNWTICDHSLV